MQKGRPELGSVPADLYYDGAESERYHANTRVRSIQQRMYERAVELLALPGGEGPLHLLDIGCGSGLSGQVLTDLGHTWTGVDVSPSMLDVAQREGCAGDLAVVDIGDGLPFRPGSFDGAISISTVQWLCTAFRRSHEPKRRIKRFFESLYACLRKGTRAVIQLYAENKIQLDMITQSALRSGFSGGVVVDYPNSTKAKKMFLVLMCGPSLGPAPAGKTGEEPLGDDDEGTGAAATAAAAAAPRDRVEMAQRERAPKKRSGAKRVDVKRKDWIAAKKERRRAQGKKTANDSKYSGRSRGPKF